jgi:uncharacterized membrane protein YbhN (UPF0104 family)
LRAAVSAALVAAAFGFALPRFASYRSVWASLQAMTWLDAVLIGVAAAASLASYWLAICAVLPSLRLREAATVNLASNAVANTLPAGGALGMGVSWAMLTSWDVSTEEYVLYTLVSGIWNVFARLGLPVLALLALLTVARPDAVLVTAAAVGLALLAAAAAGLGLVSVLAAGAGSRVSAQVTAAVLLYRAVTYLPPIPLGAAAFVAWQHAPALIHSAPVSPAAIPVYPAFEPVRSGPSPAD